MAVIPIQIADFDGDQLTFQAAAQTDQVDFDPKRVLLVNNGSGASITVTLNMVSDVLGVTVPDRTITVPAGQIWQIQLGQQMVDPTTGFVEIDYSSITTVTVACIQPPT